MTEQPSAPVTRWGWLRRWLRGWRGWVVFLVIFALFCTALGIWLAKAFEPAPDPWSEYPGVGGTPMADILDDDSVERIGERFEEVAADIRTSITAEFGFDWVQHGEPELRDRTNRFGGTSMLQQYRGPAWQTLGTLRDIDDKQRLLELVAPIIEAHGFGTPELRNTMGPDAVPEYGDFLLEDQGRWVLSARPPETTRGELRVTILDLARDRTGGLAAGSADDIASRGYEREYVSIMFVGDLMLREADREEFERRSLRYEGHLPPAPSF
ncbi:MAG: hypothetical protein KF680_09020 [Cryobacterium sp.]|nr:hypothetical protein [Cryobacterium sp.]